MAKKDLEQIQEGIQRYCDAIHTQDEEAFKALWSSHADNMLISIGTACEGTKSIYKDFLLGGIQTAYRSIVLVAQSVKICEATPDVAIAIFAYQTDCIRRETGEKYGIEGLETQIWIRENESWKLHHVHYSKRG